jgi:IS30 family transposase
MSSYQQHTQEQRYLIEERPAIVNAQRRFGDRGGDPVVGKGHRGALVTLVECNAVYGHPGRPPQDGRGRP